MVLCEKEGCDGYVGNSPATAVIFDHQGNNPIEFQVGSECYCSECTKTGAEAECTYCVHCKQLIVPGQWVCQPISPPGLLHAQCAPPGSITGKWQPDRTILPVNECLT